MTINELLAAVGLTANDVIPMWDAEATGSEEPTKKITASNFVAGMIALGNLLTTGDVVNNLNIDDTTGTKVAGQHEVYELNLVSTSTCSTNSYTSHNTVDFNKLTKRNGFVHIQLHIIFDSGSEATNAAFANVPIGYRPSSQTRIPMIIKKSNASIVYSGLIETDGYIKQSLTSSGVQEVWIDTIYQL